MSTDAFKRFINTTLLYIYAPVAVIAVKAVSFALVFLVFGLSSALTSADTSEPNLKNVKVQLKWRHQFQFAGYYMANELGYYQHVGLNVQLIEREAADGVTPIDKLLSGRVDFAITDSGALLYRSTGSPLVALAAIFQHSPSIVITRKDIKQLSGLYGKKVTMSGGYQNAELITMLQNVGLSVDHVEVIPTVASVDALIDKSTDAYNGYTVNEPYLLTQKGVEFNVFKPKDFGADFYGDVLVTTESMINETPEMVKAFREATLRGWMYAVENQEEAVRVITEKYNTQNKSYEHLLYEGVEASKLVLSDIVPIGYMNVERWQRIEEIFRQQGLLHQPVDYESFIYGAKPFNTLLKTLYEYRMHLGTSAVLLLVGLMMLHNFYLRRQVVLRTEQLDQSLAKAEIEARTDWLTGLPNRRHFFEAVKRYIGQAERRKVGLAMISLDLDHFKNINDTYGHAAGDAALVQAGKVLSQFIRKEDVLARLGGEEFSIACLDAERDNTLHLAERIREAISSSEVSCGEKRFNCTVSVGIAFWERGDTFEELLKKADQAMYCAKASGRNQTKLWSISAELVSPSEA